MAFLISMSTTIPYINIHTHQFRADGSVCIVNADDSTKIPTAHFFSAGIHPWRINSTNIAEALETLKSQASLKNMLAFGECGLDRLIDVTMLQQEVVFKAQLTIAEQHQKPVIIHCVKAFDELLHIKKDGDYSIPFIVHGYNNNAQIAEQLIKKGCMLSFGKALLKEHSNAQNIFKTIELEHVFLETDNSDVDISAIFEKAASLKAITIETLKEKIYTNFKNIFKA